jgi:4-amino-4-deoxy-L-arabinose transferase-like glycosyltransferase
MGTVTPFLWVLNHPLIYEAAVASAEFFFLGGVCWAYLALRQRRLPALFLLPAALFWALALGCQFTQVFAVAAALIVTTAWAWRRIDIRQRLWSALRLFGCLWLPALLVLVGLAWYNRERFGSVLEFGYRYQLAVVNLHEHYREIFSPGYVIANLYNYLLNPFQVSRDFPFLHPQFGTVLAGFPLHVPRIYYTEAITGLLYTAPFVMFAIIPAWLEVKGLRRGAMRAWFAEWTDERLHWLVMTLTVAVAVEMAVLLFFYYSAPRYLTAVIPPLLPVAVFGFWQGFHALSTKPRALKYYCLAAIVLACCSILVSSLLAISSSQDRFLEGNPVLMQQIGAFFSH